MSTYITRIVDHLGRLWKRSKEGWEIAECPPLRPRSPIVREFTVTEEGCLFNVKSLSIVKLLELSEQPKIRSIGVSDQQIARILITTEDNIGLVYNRYLDELVVPPIDNVSHMIRFEDPVGGGAGDSTLVMIDTNGRIRTITLDDDHNITNDAGYHCVRSTIDERQTTAWGYYPVIVPIDQVVRVHDNVIALNNEIIYLGYNNSVTIIKCEFTIVSILTVIEDYENQSNEPDLVIVDSEGLIRKMEWNKPVELIGNALSDELDDGSNWIELIELNTTSNLGIVNQSGKAYRITHNIEIARLDLPREIFHQTVMKNSRTKM